MLCRRARAGAERCSYYERHARLAAKHVAYFGGLIQQLIEAHPHEVVEHDLDDWPQARQGRADRGAEECRFADGRVEDAVAVLAIQALCHAEDASPSVK